MSWTLPMPWGAKKNSKKAWGYSFDWTPQHWTAEQMHPMKYSYDVLAEECLNRLDAISPPRSGAIASCKNVESESKTGRDLYGLLKEHSSSDEKLGAFWNKVNAVPEWVDWGQIERGQRVFYRYGGPALTALTYQSLLGGMGASRVVETLARTGGFGARVARGRMLETTQHILHVTGSLDAIKPCGAGHISTIRVRLLHAAVRRRILKLAAQKPDYFNVDELGVPINDLDSIGTIISFSATLIWVGLPRQGIWMTNQEILDYIALWRLVAYYIGCPDDGNVFSTPLQAKVFMESIMIHEMKPGKVGGVLANNIILALQNQPPTFASPEFLEAGTRWLNGNELADALDIGRPSFYYTALFGGQCLLFMLICYTYRSIPYLDARKIKRLREVLYKMIVMDKKIGLGSETTFEFKFVPSFQLGTSSQNEINDDPERKPQSVDRINISNISMVIGAGVIGLCSWFLYARAST